MALGMDASSVDAVKPFGPFHVYVAPATVGPFNVSILPEQIGELLEKVGMAGAGLTTTLCVVAAEVQLFTTTYNEYVPAAAAVADAMVGFDDVDVKLFGPLQT